MPAFTERATVSMELSPVSEFAVEYLYPAYRLFSAGEADFVTALPAPQSAFACHNAYSLR